MSLAPPGPKIRFELERGAHMQVPFLAYEGLTCLDLIGPYEVFNSTPGGIEYDPQPPFDAGSPDKAGPKLQELAMQALSGG